MAIAHDLRPVWEQRAEQWMNDRKIQPELRKLILDAFLAGFVCGEKHKEDYVIDRFGKLVSGFRVDG